MSPRKGYLSSDDSTGNPVLAKTLFYMRSRDLVMCI